MRRMWALIGLCMCGAWGCGEEVAPYDRNAMLTSVAEQLALPTHEVFATRAQTLEMAAQTACADGAMSEAERDEVRAAWWGARQAMELLPAFSVGPWRTAGLGAMLDRWPTDDVELEALVSGEAALDDALLATLGANKRGLPALEYLLWGAEEVSGRRCALTALLAKDASTSADALLMGWRGEGGFAQQLGQAGRVEGMYANAQEALGELANVAVAALEMIVGAQLGKPLGLTTGGAAQPELAECFRSERSLEVVRSNMESVWRLYAGADGGVGLGDMVRARNSGSDGRVRAAFEAVFVALDALEAAGELEQVVVSDRAKVEAAREAIREVLRLWKTEVIGALGVTLTFNDNDGD